MSELDYEQYHQKGGTYVIPVEVFDNLLEENQSLNKQLEEYKKWYQDELEENSKLSELWCDSRAKIRELENQQKEFIEYLENMLDDENDIFSVVRVKDVISKYQNIKR